MRFIAVLLAVAGLVPLGAPVSFAETGSAPPGEPLALFGVSDLNGTLTLMWQPPLDDGGAPILEYRVYWAQFPDEFAMIGVATTTQFIDLLQADPLAIYAYRVTAVNDAGEGGFGGPCIDVVIEIPPTVIIDPACLPVPCRIACLWWPPLCVPC